MKKLYILLLIHFSFTLVSNAQWVRTVFSAPAENVRPLAVIGTNLFAGTNYGVYFSSNNGSTWIQRNVGLSNLYIHSLAVNGTEIYAGTGGLGGGIFKSVNNGLSWTNVSPVGLPLFCNVNSIVISESNIFAAVEFAGWREIYKSSLTNLNSSTWSGFATPALPMVYIRSLAIHGTDILAGTYGHGVWTSPINAANWVSATTGIDPSADYIQALLVSDTNLFAGNISGAPVLYRSNNSGNNWTVSSTAIFANKPVYALAISNSMNCSPGNGKNIYAGTQGAGTLVSTDFGITWNDYNQGFKDGSGNWYCDQININSFAFIGNTMFAATDCGVWRRNCTTVPLTLTSFSATLSGKNVSCNWQTEQEINTKDFTVERSNDAVNFQTAGAVAAAGNSSDRRYYSFTDPLGRDLLNQKFLYYRLKMRDRDGSFSYSQVAQIKIKRENLVTIFPNPANTYTNIDYQLSESYKNKTLEVYDAQGVKIYIHTLTTASGTIQIPTKGWDVGVYIVKLKENGILTKSIKLIVSR